MESSLANNVIPIHFVMLRQFQYLCLHQALFQSDNRLLTSWKDAYSTEIVNCIYSLKFTSVRIPLLPLQLCYMMWRYSIRTDYMKFLCLPFRPFCYGQHTVVLLRLKTAKYVTLIRSNNLLSSSAWWKIKYRFMF